MRTLVHALLLAGLASASTAQATVFDANWTESVYATDGSSHTGLAWAPDGSDRLFVIEKGGRIRVRSGGLTTTTPAWSTFATITPVFTNSECGLIGFAFDPNFVRNRYVYFFVTVANNEQQIIRYTDVNNVGTNRSVIVGGLPTAGNNHDGGGIGFARDGKLYWSIGDLGNGSGVNNNLTSLAAKVGRANRNGTVPGDNPFDDGPGPNNDYIWARGMRNPFTMQIQPGTWDMWLNVVGDGYEQVFLVQRGDHAGYNMFENNQPAGFITPKIVYRTNGSDNRSITAVTRTGGVATFTTSSNHRFRPGTNLTISGVTDTSFNSPNPVYVATTPTATTFTALIAGPDATSAGGSAVTLDQGGCLTGGVFYDASLASPPYRGNFFYGDCNTGRIMRARIDTATNTVLSTDYWGDDIAAQVDIAVGPDGSLYYTGVGTSNIYRATFNVAAQGLVVGNLNLRADEDGQVATTVRLAMVPPGQVDVTVANTAGDTDVEVRAGATLTFDPTNWSRPQAVRLRALGDFDLVDDAATVSVSAAGMTAVPISVTVLDLGALETPLFEDGFE